MEKKKNEKMATAREAIQFGQGRKQRVYRKQEGEEKQRKLDRGHDEISTHWSPKSKKREKKERGTAGLP